ncbi:TIGR01620 family protein [Rhodosalinus halophilus]|uniref:TIGR01620 family protein n=1 Tax=Rhodosalinus halophilus TaxID=2259333 RepID=A0A365U6N7_9RHOB|nr:TIGR01620 family protein [Rhodosalinus halophilus]RBI84267.1 TIGR01620 family protein [Rhodosalinus halophilus]
MTDRRGPVLIEIDEETPRSSPAEAPPIPDSEPPEGRAMQQAAALAAARPSRLARWFWGLLAALLASVISIAAWDFATGLIARQPFLGWGVTALFAAFVAVLAAIAVKEAAAFSRLARIDALHRAADAALADSDLEAARRLTERLTALYARRPETDWGRSRLAERKAEQFDAEALLGLVERELLAPLDARARAEVESAARQVAAVTALVPLALADVVGALAANIRMIRRIAEIYGGRSGTLGSLRLLRAVFTHLVATGAVAVGDDLISSVAGGGLLSRVSRRFGEGVVNGALTARVGIAAMEVCRPLPFRAAARPSVSGVVHRALTGLFGSATR